MCLNVLDLMIVMLIIYNIIKNYVLYFNFSADDKSDPDEVSDITSIDAAGKYNYVLKYKLLEKFGEKWGTECLNIRFPLLTLLYARYSVKVININ